VQQYEDGIGTSYAYNAANEITTAGTLTYTFDANGNELTNSGGLSYTYNAKNQTSNVSSTQPPNSLGMTYTGPGQSERLSAGNRTYTYSLMGMYSQTASGTFTSSVNMPAATLGAKPAASIQSPVQAALMHNQPGTVSTALTSPAGTYYYTKDPQGTLVSESTPNGKFYYSFSAVQPGIGPNPGALSIAATTDSTGAIAAAGSRGSASKTPLSEAAWDRSMGSLRSCTAISLDTANRLMKDASQSTRSVGTSGAPRRKASSTSTVQFAM